MEEDLTNILWAMFNSMQKLKQASPKARRPNTILSTDRKGANTNKKTATDMNTLLRYIEANGMKNGKTESVPASELDHFFVEICLNARRKNGEEWLNRRQFAVFSPE